MSDSQILDELINQTKTKRVDEPRRQFVKPDNGKVVQKRSEAEIEEALLRVRQYAFLQVERTQAFVDGAILAAEQVQDKRLDLLEQGPELTVSEVLFDMFLTMALESTIAGKVLAGITKKLLKSALSSVRVFSVLPKFALSERGRNLKWLSQLMKERGGKQVARNTIKKFLTPSNELTIAQYNRTLQVLYQGGSNVEQNLTAIAKGGKAGAQQLLFHGSNPPPVLSFGDSVSVSILSAAQVYASQQRLAIFLSHSTFEMWLRLDLVEIEDMEMICKSEITDEEVTSINTLRDQYKLLYEAIIWAKLFGLDANLSKLSPTQTKLSGVPDKHLNYWLNRFINPQTGKQFAQSSGTEFDKVYALNKYFINIAETYRKIKSATGDDGIHLITPLKWKGGT
jgi:hypothetical protein